MQSSVWDQFPSRFSLALITKRLYLLLSITFTFCPIHAHQIPQEEIYADFSGTFQYDSPSLQSFYHSPPHIH